MQLIQDSVQPVNDILFADTFLWPGIFSVDSTFVDSSALAKDRFINLFQGHELRPKHETAQQLHHEKSGWLFFALIFVVAIFAYLRVAYNKYLNRLLSALFNVNITNQIVRDENILVKRASILLNVIFYVAAALLVYLVSVQYRWEVPFLKTGIVRFLLLGGIIAQVYFFKFLILKVTGWLFNITREMSIYIFNILLINNLLGIALIPILAMFVFFGHMQFDWLLTAAIIVAGCAYLYRLFRGVLVGLGTSGVSPAYLFLYICALEIAPLFVLIKLIYQQ
jgi:hypothetical protein